MHAKFLRFLAVLTMTLLVAAQLAFPATPALAAPRQDESIIASPTPTVTPTVPSGNCGGIVCG